MSQPKTLQDALELLDECASQLGYAGCCEADHAAAMERCAMMSDEVSEFLADCDYDGRDKT